MLLTISLTLAISSQGQSFTPFGLGNTKMDLPFGSKMKSIEPEKDEVAESESSLNEAAMILESIKMRIRQLEEQKL